MAVIFDEVVTELEGPPPAPEASDRGRERRVPDRRALLRRLWQEERRRDARRRLRLEAD